MTNDDTPTTFGLGFCWFCATHKQYERDDLDSALEPAVTARRGTPMCLSCAQTEAENRRGAGKSW